MRASRTFRLRAAALLVAALATVSGVATGEDPSANAERELPIYLQGLDLDLPTQELFRHWPPSDLVERPYWLSWGGGALHRAALFNRPILFVLDVHWSGASAEMFETVLKDRRVLRAINDGFVSVRVNADMRPDVRERYQTGTWPAIAFLMPNGKPMLSRVNEMGADRPITTGAVDAETLMFLLREGVEYWRLESDELVRRGEVWSKTEGPRKPLLGVVEGSASDKMALWMSINADPADGGFGAAPKLVVPALTEYATVRRGRGPDDQLAHARLTLERLVASPLWDEAEGGVRRLAASPEFGDVQTEKLLSGNAALVRELATSLRQEHSDGLRDALRATGGFLADGLGREGGGFYLARRAVRAEDGGVDAGVDRIVLAGPNAMAGAAMLRAGAALDDAKLEAAGLVALRLVHARAFSPGRGVRHVIEPLPSTRLYLETLADSAFGFIDAYETTGDPEFLNAARAIADDALALLDDPESTALLDHKADDLPVGLLGHPRRPLRANVRMARALIRLDLQGVGSRYREAAIGIVGYFSGDLSGFRSHGIEAALAIEEAIAEPLLISISGAGDDERTRRLRRAAVTSPWPWTVVSNGAESARSAARIEWRGEAVVVNEPDAVHEAIRKMTGGEGTP